MRHGYLYTLIKKEIVIHLSKKRWPPNLFSYLGGDRHLSTYAGGGAYLPLFIYVPIHLHIYPFTYLGRDGDLLIYLGGNDNLSAYVGGGAYLSILIYISIHLRIYPFT
jgi:hypothetical protein